MSYFPYDPLIDIINEIAHLEARQIRLREELQDNEERLEELNRRRFAQLEQETGEDVTSMYS